LAGERIDENGSRILLEPKLLRLLPERYKKVYQHHLKGVDDAEHPDIQEWVVRAHLIVDFISGMTDDFAMSTYRNASGHRTVNAEIPRAHPYWHVRAVIEQREDVVCCSGQLLRIHAAYRR
jgi:hypothetical protein